MKFIESYRSCLFEALSFHCYHRWCQHPDLTADLIEAFRAFSKSQSYFFTWIIIKNVLVY